jgi:mono/diheme cytochrome c family protein
VQTPSADPRTRNLASTISCQAKGDTALACCTRRRNLKAVRRLVRSLLLAGAAVAACVGLGGAWIASAPRPAFSSAHVPILDEAGDVGRGGIVFRAGDCASCHASPGQSDHLRLGGGLALDSPYGIFHVPNISSDPTDGIGGWSTEDLANALLSGVSPKGQHYYPAFPYVAFAHMRLEDVRDLMAYLRTLPPVPGRPPPHELPFPLTIRRILGLWKLLYLDRSPIKNDPGRSSAWNRGHYLVEALGHCAECHSTRNSLGAVKASARFAGGPDPSGTGYIPNITPAQIGGWSEADIATMLKTGATPDLRVVGSSMADVVRNTSGLPDSDRGAIAVYIKALPARPTPLPAGNR